MSSGCISIYLRYVLSTGVAGVDVHLWLLSVWEMAMEKNEIAKQREYVCSLVLNPNKMKFWKKKSPKEILNLISDDENVRNVSIKGIGWSVKPVLFYILYPHTHTW